MSASLVGSEMCIRDSPGSSRRRTGAPARLPLPASLSWTRAGRCGPPVSYTHLTLPTICSV
eukprot:14445132-Alexandrium_andersonii.AAC.1